MSAEAKPDGLPVTEADRAAESAANGSAMATNAALATEARRLLGEPSVAARR
jgi:hypothetical protein